MDHLWERIGPAMGEPLPPDQLLHALMCDRCRDWLVKQLLDQEAGDETAEDLYAAAFLRLEAPELVEAARARRGESEELLGELLSFPAESRPLLLAEERFRSLDVLDLLVERSHSSQVENPKLALGLAELASRLAAGLGDEEPDASALVSRSFCLGANACRLQNDVWGAEAQLAKAAPFLACPGEKAFYCRTAALVRWEEGRTEEAMALLGHAHHVYQAEGPEEEGDVCGGLMGLLLFEENDIPEALPRLHRAWKRIDRERRPILSLRIGMALAISLALAQQRERSRQVRQEAWKFYSRVRDAREMLRVYAYEGRLLGLLGDLEEAEQVLESVRQKLLEECSFGESALASLDLAMVLAEKKRVDDIVHLSEALAKSAPQNAPMDLAVGALLNFASLLNRGEILPWEYAGAAGVALRRSFRAVGLRLRPLPFA